MKLQLDYKWSAGTSRGILAFIVIWVCVVCGVGYTSYERDEAAIPIAALLVLSSGLYWIGAMTVNSTHLLVTPTALQISHGPLPWPGNKSIRLADVQSFDVMEVPEDEGENTFRIGCKLKIGPFLEFFPRASIRKPATALELVAKLVTGLEPYHRFEINRD